jgi:predicted Zn-dependent protease
LEQPNFPVAWRLLAASAALAGRLDQAQEARARALKLDPGFVISNLADYATLRRPEDVDRYEEGLRLAGLRV